MPPTSNFYILVINLFIFHKCRGPGFLYYFGVYSSPRRSLSILYAHSTSMRTLCTCYLHTFISMCLAAYLFTIVQDFGRPFRELDPLVYSAHSAFLFVFITLHTRLFLFVFITPHTRLIFSFLLLLRIIFIIIWSANSVSWTQVLILATFKFQ